MMFCYYKIFKELRSIKKQLALTGSQHYGKIDKALPGIADIGGYYGSGLRRNGVAVPVNGWYQKEEEESDSNFTELSHVDVLPPSVNQQMPTIRVIQNEDKIDYRCSELDVNSTNSISKFRTDFVMGERAGIEYDEQCSLQGKDNTLEREKSDGHKKDTDSSRDRCR